MLPVTQPTHSPGIVRRTAATVLGAVRQPARLSIGVAGVLGGAMLLTTNVASSVVVGGGAFPWVPLTANVALIFGGVMFFREYRRAALSSLERSGPAIPDDVS